MTKILIVEDSRTFSSMLVRAVDREFGFETRVARSMAQAREILAAERGFLAALLDINLPDAPNGEIVDLILDHEVPPIIFTGEMDDTLRERFWAMNIVDYVLKRGGESLEHVLGLIKRLRLNPAIRILVVDDSRASRARMANLLEAHAYQVLEAPDGLTALEMVEANPDLRMVITDSYMPGLDGYELAREIRRVRGRDRLAIIGVSGEEGQSLSARFLKNGANDFLHKPFASEEFYARVTQNIETLEHIAEIRELADKDYLTKLYNRRYFYTNGPQALEASKGQPVALAMLDIDYFKRVNDTFGHEAGDAVLCHLAGLLGGHFGPEAIVARLGGEEFCVLIPGQEETAAAESLETLRRLVEQTPVRLEAGVIPYTVSLGLCCESRGGLDEMIKEADGALYRSKNAGRNRLSLAGRG